MVAQSGSSAKYMSLTKTMTICFSARVTTEGDEQINTLTQGQHSHTRLILSASFFRITFNMLKVKHNQKGSKA